MKRVYLHILLISILFNSCSRDKRFSNLDFSNDELLLINGILYYKNVPFSGNIVSNYDASKLKSETQYDKGRKHGFEKQWLYNGHLILNRYYIKGNKAGIHKAWWENGSLKFEYHFNNEGEYNGTVKEWYKSGQIFLAFNYNEGKEVGSQKMWKLDGSLRANYEVVNGERFGLIGLKKCYQVTVGSTEVKLNNM